MTAATWRVVSSNSSSCSQLLQRDKYIGSRCWVRGLVNLLTRYDPAWKKQVEEERKAEEEKVATDLMKIVARSVKGGLRSVKDGSQVTTGEDTEL